MLKHFKNNNNYNFKHLDIKEQFIWLMSNEENFIINQLYMILKLHSYRNDIIQINNSNILYYTVLIIFSAIGFNRLLLLQHHLHLSSQRWQPSRDEDGRPITSLESHHSTPRLDDSTPRLDDSTPGQDHSTPQQGRSSLFGVLIWPFVCSAFKWKSNFFTGVGMYSQTF